MTWCHEIESVIKNYAYTPRKRLRVEVVLKWQLFSFANGK